MNTAIEYLYSFLKDEFGDQPEIRIRLAPTVKPLRSVDQEQTYDPETSNLHLKQGVFVKYLSREYFFPVEWVLTKKYAQIEVQVKEIRDLMY